MNTYFKVYIKLFFRAAIPFGVIMGLLYIIMFGFKLGLMKDIFAGGLFGLFMSVILGTLHIIGTNKILSNHRENKYSVKQITTVKVNQTYDITYDYCISKFSDISNWVLLTQDIAGNKITFKTTTTRKSFGEIITVELIKSSDEITEIIIESKPNKPTVIVDCGKNLENILIAEDLLNRLSIA